MSVTGPTILSTQPTFHKQLNLQQVSRSATSPNSYSHPNNPALMAIYQPENDDFGAYTRSARQIPMSAVPQHQHQHQHQHHQHQHQHQHQHHSQSGADRNHHINNANHQPTSNSNANGNNRFSTNMDQPLPLPLPMPAQFTGGARSIKSSILGSDQELMPPTSMYGGMAQQSPAYSPQNAISTSHIKQESSLAAQRYQEALMNSGKRVGLPNNMTANINHNEWAQHDPKRVKRDSISHHQELLPRPVGSDHSADAESSRPKVYVLKACVSCKASHVACDVGRPCQRCVRLNKADTCIDAERKKRGRPCNSAKKATSGPTGPPGNTVAPNGRPSSPPRGLNSQHDHEHLPDFYMKKRPIMPQMLAPIGTYSLASVGLPNFTATNITNIDTAVVGGLFALSKQGPATVNLPQVSHPLPPLSPEASPQQTPSVIHNGNGANMGMSSSSISSSKASSNGMNTSLHPSEYSPDIVEIATALLMSSRGGDAPPKQ